jgi:hypothetical protein
VLPVPVNLLSLFGFCQWQLNDGAQDRLASSKECTAPSAISRPIVIQLSYFDLLPDRSREPIRNSLFLLGRGGGFFWGVAAPPGGSPSERLHCGRGGRLYSRTMTAILRNRHLRSPPCFPSRAGGKREGCWADQGGAGTGEAVGDQARQRQVSGNKKAHRLAAGGLWKSLPRFHGALGGSSSMASSCACRSGS